MNDLLIQLFGLFLLIGGIAWSYWRWIRPHQVDFEAKLMLLLIVLTMAGGLVGSTGWWTDNPSAFAWDLPPLASRMLGAAGWTFAAACFLTLQRPTAKRVRLVLLMLAVYLVPLTVAILFFHLDRFDFSAPITYAFFAVVLLMIVSTLWYLVRSPAVPTDSEPDSAQPSQPTRLWLTLVAVVSGFWGAALFLSDSGPVALIWVWPGDLLTSRLIAVMLLTIATAALYTLRSPESLRLALVALVVYGFGAALANLLNIAAGKPVQMLYVLGFGLMGVVSSYLLARRAA